MNKIKLLLIGTFTAIMMIACAPTPEELVSQGKSLLETEDCNAMECFQKAAEQGNVEANYLIGKMYFEGVCVENDNEIAADWYKKAAEKDYADAQNMLAKMYFEGIGVQQDYDKSAKWALKALEFNDYTESLYVLSMMYLSGMGVPKDDDKAVEMYSKYKNITIPQAMVEIGNMYYKGEGVAQNIKDAKSLWQKAADQGDNEAANLLKKLEQEEKAKAFHNRTFTVNGVRFEMIAVKGGTFVMGCTSDDDNQLIDKMDEDEEDGCYDNEKPAHKVTLSDYYVGKYEVTYGLWKAVMNSYKDNILSDDMPVDNVGWSETQDFIERLYVLTGLRFRLLTEAEWEYAAKGGNKSKGYKYSGSNDLDLVAWHDGIHPVGQKKPNELGIYDMSGNVWEWCQDWYDYYSEESQINPCVNETTSQLQTRKVLRGGSNTIYGDCYYVTCRYMGFGFGLKGNGFRLAISCDEATKPMEKITNAHNEKVVRGDAWNENVFSVSKDKRVKFSKGNIQYQPSTGKWRFAEHQWDYIGEANKNISSSYSGWIDLFGHGTGDDPAKCTTDYSDYQTFNDWGNNNISNGNGYNWRTLTMEECIYVLCRRETSSGILYTKAIVNGVNGFLLLPDNWKKEYYKLYNVNDGKATYKSNIISLQDWKDKLETHGAIFMPAAGYREGTKVGKIGEVGYYWSSRPSRQNGAFVLFADGRFCANEFVRNCRGNSVRLVCDILQR